MLMATLPMSLLLSRTAAGGRSVPFRPAGDELRVEDHYGFGDAWSRLCGAGSRSSA